ncbi:MAG: hypothetical protein P1U87_03885 [Verrucomicrobiales bacterium]|nr:hypothetical protein [Verrucomicrobiales bacterium]
MKPIYYWRYTLRSRSHLNAASIRTEHEGALIKIGEGHGCLHPWPELGDAPLDAQLKILSEGRETPLIEGAKQCAECDEQLREVQVGIAGCRIPTSHWLVRPGDDPEFAREEGFAFAKIKGTGDLKLTRKIMGDWMAAGFQIRLDFNECLPAGGFLEFWNELTWEERAAIDFVEDPEAYGESGWEPLRHALVPIAVDRDPAQRLRQGDVLVMKPARPDWPAVPDSKYLITSYMDHAIGQMFAAYVATVAYGGETNAQRLPCGLLTHRCFEDDEFFERIRTDGPRLLPVEGTGLGFDDLLEKLPWKRLN